MTKTESINKTQRQLDADLPAILRSREFREMTNKFVESLVQTSECHGSVWSMIVPDGKVVLSQVIAMSLWINKLAQATNAKVPGGYDAIIKLAKETIDACPKND